MSTKVTCLNYWVTYVYMLSYALFFTGSPTTRWVSVALGAGVGIGAAYTECSYLFNGAPPKWSPKVGTVPSAYSEATALSFSVNPDRSIC